MKKQKAKFICTINVTDPDSKNEVRLDIFKTKGGGMIGIDSSFIETEEKIFSPFDKNIEITI